MDPKPTTGDFWYRAGMTSDITAHLARPSIPEAQVLPGGPCEAASLCLARADLVLRSPIYLSLACGRRPSRFSQLAVPRSREFWCAMLNGLHAGCKLLHSATCGRWKRLAHCTQQGKCLYLGEPTWQLKIANAASTAPGAPCAAVLWPRGEVPGQVTVGSFCWNSGGWTGSGGGGQKRKSIREHVHSGTRALLFT